jgi:hypothetical protein
VCRLLLEKDTDSYSVNQKDLTLTHLYVDFRSGRVGSGFASLNPTRAGSGCVKCQPDPNPNPRGSGRVNPRGLPRTGLGMPRPAKAVDGRGVIGIITMIITITSRRGL